MAVDAKERFCPICGMEAADPTFKRFGEWACSEEHAEQYVKEVRAQRLGGPGGRRAVGPPMEQVDEEYEPRYAPRYEPRLWWSRFGRRGGC